MIAALCFEHDGDDLSPFTNDLNDGVCFISTIIAFNSSYKKFLRNVFVDLQRLQRFSYKSILNVAEVSYFLKHEAPTLNVCADRGIFQIMNFYFCL